ncbi:hypothetical protein GPECTOR_528g521 [Gonium pectorale]|uniref:Uncharacterized protein n=1 Tax=Gonium pectorale TaxID=33097 RepID=A0A150FUT1_GONPE|nr:hypothetical protein GPECTOR_528g521 [Gonium pectorale]|eukprot:KXZ41349.1 hypothetical protein GPECTOR_528g521 [Gonium pectorale]
MTYIQDMRTKLDQVMQEVTQRLPRTDREAAEDHAELAALQQRLEEAQREQEAKQAELESTRQESADQSARLQAALDEARAEKQAYGTQAKMLYDRWAESSNEQGRLAGALAASTTEKAQVQEALAAREAAYAELHHRLSEYERVLAMSNMEKSQAQEALATREAAYAELHRQLTECEERLAARETEKAQLQAQVKEAEATVAGLRSGQAQLSAAAAAHKALYNQHYQRRKEVEAEKEQAQAELRASQAAVNDLQHQLSAANAAQAAGDAEQAALLRRLAKVEAQAATHKQGLDREREGREWLEQERAVLLERHEELEQELASWQQYGKGAALAGEALVQGVVRLVAPGMDPQQVAFLLSGATPVPFSATGIPGLDFYSRAELLAALVDRIRAMLETFHYMNGELKEWFWSMVSVHTMDDCWTFVREGADGRLPPLEEGIIVPDEAVAVGAVGRMLAERFLADLPNGDGNGDGGAGGSA